MLPAANRIRSANEFSYTVRSGVRSGRRNLVLYTVVEPTGPSCVGFIVAKTVGNAVVRNRVRRRLRAAAAQTISAQPSGLKIVVRALPAAAAASWPELLKDYNSALQMNLEKVRRSDSTRSEGKVRDGQ
ncbi:ribonuclease P protein component [Psychromicrobium lacuslunae]|uniref:Ribonuclease P protein component n=1 Tax=Psychromicrobium lacuslunae TaxID=1618207 RepID=A0A0D4C0Q3_9MICC|nr:ribonuclease P protein component [Psychromicrobium lacuslunae]AJT42257.1 ribonuclease P [Psychromicrobium lacuslunae]